MGGASLISLPGGMDILMAPVMHNLIPYTALVDGSITLCDLYDMLDAISVKAENEARVRSALESRGRK